MPDDALTAEGLDWQMRELVSCLRTDPCAYDHTCAHHRTFHDLLTRYGDARERARAEEHERLARLGEALTFTTLREATVRRCEQIFHPLAAWSLTDWATAAAGELGEACNVIKKMRRFEGSHNDPARNVDPASDEGKRALAHEIADTVIYLDLLAARAGIDLGEAVCEKFNLVSRRCGSSIMLAAAIADAGAGKERGDG